MVWRYFKRSEDKKLAKCCKCGKEYRTSGNTTNLSDHLKRFHPALNRVSSEAPDLGRINIFSKIVKNDMIFYIYIINL